MSRHEHSDPNAEYTGLLGPAELLQYPGQAGEAQFAEKYSTPGTEIAWEDHPDTATAAPETAEKRRAIITDTGNRRYYLRGNTLYDLTASADKQQLISVELDVSPMEDLVIGEDAAFTNQREVTSVVIATEISADDEQKATPETESPFDAWDKALAGLREKDPRKGPAQQDAGGFIVEATWPEPNFHGAYEYTHHPTRPGAVTNLHSSGNPQQPTLEDRLLEADSEPGQLSYFGREMSPRSGVGRPTNFASARKTYGYRPGIRDIPQIGRERDAEKIKEILDDAINEYIQRADDAAVKKARETRNQKYKPRKLGTGVDDMRETLHEVTHSVKALLHRGRHYGHRGQKFDDGHH
jgi:hypothetical protein